MSKQILVIDDEPSIRRSFQLALEDTGYQVDTAASGMEGLEMEKFNRYDLICLDLKMPGLDGVDTLKELRKLDTGVPVYIVTAFYEEFFDRLDQALREGIEFEVLRKPISADQIVLFVHSVLEGSNAGA